MLSAGLFDRVREVLCLGAHCDDIEIGCGGLLSTLALAQPQARFRFVVMAGSAERTAETHNALERLLPAGRGFDLQVLGFRDGFFPADWERIKAAFEGLKAGPLPDLVLTHYGDDRHQDHRVVNELTWNTFRNHLVLEYEIPKWDSDLGRPQVFLPLDAPTVDRKVNALLEAFASQRARNWFTEDLFRGFMRMRGMECNAPSGFAEAFHVRKLVVG